MKRPKNIKEDAQLLTGIGASSWFHISKENDKYRISRYSEKGKLECSGRFCVNDKSFNIEKSYQFTYISHCQECVIIQNSRRYILKLDKNEN